MDYRGDHAIVFFPGSTAAEEGNEENQDTDSDEDNGRSWGWGVADHEGAMKRHLNHDSHDNQCEAT